MNKIEADKFKKSLIELREKVAEEIVAKPEEAVSELRRDAGRASLPPAACDSA